MPIYCYRDSDGNLIEKEMSISEKQRLEHPDGWMVDSETGKIITRDLFEEHKNHRHSPGLYPLHSDSLGVHPDQISDQIKADREIGAPETKFDQFGRAIFESRRHRREYAKAHGFIDRDAGYSDPQ